jgi:hypothetical protein
MGETKTSADLPSVKEGVLTVAQSAITSLEQTIAQIRRERETLVSVCHRVLTAVKGEFPETQWSVSKTPDGWLLTLYSNQTVGDIDAVVRSERPRGAGGLRLDFDYMPLCTDTEAVEETGSGVG